MAGFLSLFALSFLLFFHSFDRERIILRGCCTLYTEHSCSHSYLLSRTKRENCPVTIPEKETLPARLGSTSRDTFSSAQVFKVTELRGNCYVGRNTRFVECVFFFFFYVARRSLKRIKLCVSSSLRWAWPTSNINVWPSPAEIAVREGSILSSAIECSTSSIY